MYQYPRSPSLLQGDVIDFFDYPVLLSRHAQPPETINIAVKRHRIAVVSHSCDITESSANKRPAFLIAPLQPVPNYIIKDPQKYEAFKRTKVESEKPNFISLFRYKEAPEIGGTEQMIDLSTIQAVPITYLPICCRMKLLELTSVARENLQEKLMLHLGVNR